MSCQYNRKLQKYLDEGLSSKEMLEVEAHIEECHDCQTKLDSLIEEPVVIVKESLNIDDEVLIDRIKAHRKGVRRITLYGVLGFILGLFSRYYTTDPFIVTKALMALPYKLAEFALSPFFSKNAISPWDQWHYRVTMGFGYFPYHPILGAVVEFITPAIIVTFIAIMIGHLVSDKRVFRRKNIVKFILAGIIVFSLWIGVVHIIYSRTITQIEELNGIKSVIIYERDERSTSWLIKIDQYNLGIENHAEFLSDISNAEIINSTYYGEIGSTGYELAFEFNGGGRMIGQLDESGAFIMQNRRLYQLSEDTMNLLKQIVGRDINEEKN
ncbi:anti-sigma factor family protein [Alkaliphilus peptidifermentans]|uniref:Anti-sigma-W factor RsiW n=1 Tax=Alkaliphilus peptidifermentans DSM 18978 TaxID=1120976 RepID=A0A1G5JQG8_9FIRM|nr:zf-HC2 domain-containing protein [Alkaliphilus peptidifermentans]SCY90635.1 Putative zinc-finger [Alkaliphilus peptidifermentans DSM 18978]